MSDLKVKGVAVLVRGAMIDVVFPPRQVLLVVCGKVELLNQSVGLGVPVSVEIDDDVWLFKGLDVEMMKGIGRGVKYEGFGVGGPAEL